MSKIKVRLEWDLSQKKEELELAELDFENAKEALERLKNLQKTDLNYWAQIDYQRMLPSAEKQFEIYLEKLNNIKSEVLEIEDKLSNL